MGGSTYGRAQQGAGVEDLRNIGHLRFEPRQPFVEAGVVGPLQREDVDRDATPLEGQNLVEDERLREDRKLAQDVDDGLASRVEVLRE